jgi:hypothetical protein
MALSIVSQAVCSQPADADISPMKSCFQLERVVQIECLEHLSRELPDRNNQNSAELQREAGSTMSPVDYSPMITATTSSQPVAKDAPATFVIRCRDPRTDLLVSTEGSCRASRASELQVDFSVNEQPAVRTRAGQVQFERACHWMLSGFTDGPSARLGEKEG